MKRDYRNESPIGWLFNSEAENAKTYGKVAGREIAAIRWYLTKQDTPTKITHSDDAIDFIRAQIGLNSFESFIVLYLSRAHTVIRHEILTVGSAVATAVDIQRIVKNALNCNAQALIIAHNHPSGNKSASGADQQITKRVQEAAELFEIKLLDSLIITLDSFSSII